MTLETGLNGWSRLELRYLAALGALAEEGSFGRAADRFGYTQSAVRPRGGRIVSLTDASELLLRDGAR